MKKFVFPYSVSFGKGDSYSDKVCFELSDVNAKRLIRSAEEGGRIRLGEDNFIDDIVIKVYREIDKQLFL